MESLSDAIKYHSATTALSLHFFGNVVPYANTTIEILSLNFFGNKVSEKVVYLTGYPSETAKAEIVKHLLVSPFTIFVFEDTSSWSQLDFLASALDDNFPHIEDRLDQQYTRRASTNQAIFIFMTDRFHKEVERLSRKKDFEALNTLAKDQLKWSGWPHRVCQRIRFLIPFV